MSWLEQRLKRPDVEAHLFLRRPDQPIVPIGEYDYAVIYPSVLASWDAGPRLEVELRRGAGRWPYCVVVARVEGRHGRLVHAVVFVALRRSEADGIVRGALATSHVDPTATLARVFGRPGAR